MEDDEGLGPLRVPVGTTSRRPTQECLSGEEPEPPGRGGGPVGSGSGRFTVGVQDLVRTQRATGGRTRFREGLKTRVGTPGWEVPTLGVNSLGVSPGHPTVPHPRDSRKIKMPEKSFYRGLDTREYIRGHPAST